MINEKSIRQAQLPLLCTVVPVGYMLVIIRPLHKWGETGEWSG